MTGPDDRAATVACICACAKTHPPARLPRCRQRAVATRVVRAVGVGAVPMPLCHGCAVAWGQHGLGLLPEE